MPNYWFDHVHLISPDPLRTSLFYEDMFGARRASVAEVDIGTLVRLELGGSIINIVTPRKKPLLPGASGPGYGLEHFALRTDNLVQAAAELKARDVRFAVDVIEPTPGFKTSFLIAPENVLVELLEEK